MPVLTPDTAAEVDNRSRTDVARVVSGARPFLGASFWGGIVSALANRIYDFYLSLDESQRESIPDTAVKTLERWAAIWGVTKLAATLANGFIDVRGVLGTQTPNGTVWALGGERYESTAAGSGTLAVALAVASITESGGVATLTTTDPHNLAGSGAGYELGLTGSGESDYNLDPLPTLVITGEKTLTFTVPGSPTPDDDPSSATLALSNILFGSEKIPVTAITAGPDSNVGINTGITLEGAITDLLDVAHAIFGGLSGGVEIEKTEPLRDRYLDVMQNPTAHFNDPDITRVCKEVSGVTRVFVRRPPVVTLGTTTVYFMRDDETPQIPDATEVANVKTALTGGTVGAQVFPGIVPANMSFTDLTVAAPVEVTPGVGEVFTFDALVPDTPEMRGAIEASLKQFFEEETDVGIDVQDEAIVAAIQNSVDPFTGAKVTSFNHTAPAGDITVATGKIATLGMITWSI